MANLKILDGDGSDKYLSMTGIGTNGDPFVPQQSVTVSDGGGSITVDGPLTDTQLRAADVKVTLDGEAVAVTDGGGSLTVDGAVTAQPSVVTMTYLTGTAASSGDNTIIAAPGSGQRIVIHMMKYQLEAATATTLIWKSGSTSRGRLAMPQYQGFVDAPPTGKEIRLAENQALVFNLSGANSVGYEIRYTVEAV